MRQLSDNQSHKTHLIFILKLHLNCLQTVSFFLTPFCLFSDMDILFTLKHLLFSGFYNGHRVHSPNIFDFYIKAIFSKENFDYSLAENTLKNLKKSKQKIKVLSVGAKGNGSITEKEISKIAKNSSSYGRYGRLLQRISAYLKPKKILELGTSLGIGTIYLSSGYKDSKVITIEACPQTQKFAENNFKNLGIINIKSINANFDDVLDTILTENEDISLIFVDGNHTYEATKKYFATICQHAKKQTVAIFDDINWSSGMSKAWNEIKNSEKTIVAIETLRMGIIFFDSNLTQKIYCTRY